MKIDFTTKLYDLTGKVLQRNVPSTIAGKQSTQEDLTLRLVAVDALQFIHPDEGKTITGEEK